MRTETNRSEFEEWAKDKVTSLKRDDIDGEYFWAETELAWEAWQAAKQFNKNFVEAGRICAQIYMARNITLSENEVLSALVEIDKLYRDENHN
jgi:hypothetical protein